MEVATNTQNRLLQSFTLYSSLDSFSYNNQNNSLSRAASSYIVITNHQDQVSSYRVYDAAQNSFRDIDLADYLFAYTLPSPDKFFLQVYCYGLNALKVSWKRD